MRQIASIADRDTVDRFADHLRSQGIACTVDSGPDGFRVWVHDDDRIPAAKTELTEFLADPNHERYRDASRRAMDRFHADVKRMNAMRRNTVNLADRWRTGTQNECPTTFILLALMIAEAIFVGFEPKADNRLANLLRFSTDLTINPILRGEVWRLITPIFIHYGPWHVLFNMTMLYQLGLLIETRLGTFRMLAMVLVIAAISNFAQFNFTGPGFGGMSGVNYGLFGYCWIKGRLDPGSGFALNPQSILLMLLWFFLCLFDIVEGVANWAHGAGLVTGMAIAYGEWFINNEMQRK